MKRFTLACALVIAGCCSEARLDTSSPDAFKRSIEAITKPMSESERAEFGRVIAFATMADAFKAGGMNQDGLRKSLAKYNGMTAREIIAASAKR